VRTRLRSLSPPCLPPPAQGQRLDRLTLNDAQRAIDFRKRELSPRILQLARRVLQRAMKAAAKKRLIDKSPLAEPGVA
jgi:hypothetical protein